MNDPTFDSAVTIKTTGAAKLALDRVVAELRATGRVTWKGKRVTKEAIVNAVWLWLDDLPPSVVEEAMAVYVPRLEALMRGEVGMSWIEVGGRRIDLAEVATTERGRWMTARGGGSSRAPAKVPDRPPSLTVVLRSGVKLLLKGEDIDAFERAFADYVATFPGGLRPDVSLGLPGQPAEAESLQPDGDEPGA